MTPITFQKAQECDLNCIKQLYDDLNDHLESTINYPKWKKGIYPIKITAEDALKAGTLFVLKQDAIIVGSVILSHVAGDAYQKISWNPDFKESEVLIIYTFVIHPQYLKQGLGKTLLEKIKNYAKEMGIRAIRLDVSEHNMPAIALYERCHYQYIATVDLGLSIPELKWFKLYQLVI